MRLDVALELQQAGALILDLLDEPFHDGQNIACTVAVVPVASTFLMRYG
jgi:hypothetical protein